MGSWGYLFFMAAIITVGILGYRHTEKARDRVYRAYEIGQLRGNFEGWMAHAKGMPLRSMPPILYDVEEALGQRHGWGGWRDSFYDYLSTPDLPPLSTLEGLTLEEWQARKLKELNEKYLKPGQ
jgi:hypothetical protein